MERMHLLEKALEIERLALVTLQLIESKNTIAMEFAFEAALPQAYRLLQLTEEFLNEKERQAEAATEEWRQSPEGQAILADRRAKFDEMQKRYQEREETSREARED